MAINTIQGSNAYTPHKSTPVQIDDTLLKNQNREAAQTDLNRENTRAVQDAVNVRITQAALDRQAAERSDQPPALPSVQAADSKETDQADQSPAQARQASYTINIFA